MNAIRDQKTQFLNFTKKREEVKNSTQYFKKVQKPKSIEIFEKVHQLQSEISHLDKSRHDISKHWRRSSYNELYKSHDLNQYDSLESVVDKHGSFMREVSSSTQLNSSSSIRLSGKVSPGMIEYMYSPTFSIMLEEKKLKNLEEFFVVRIIQEKYMMVNGLLDKHVFKAKLKERIHNIVKKSLKDSIIYTDPMLVPSTEKQISFKKPLIDEEQFTNYWDCRLGNIDNIVKEAVEKLLHEQKLKAAQIEKFKLFKDKPKKQWIPPNKRYISSKVRLIMDSDASFSEFRKKTRRSSNTKAEISSILQAGRSLSNLHNHRHSTEPSHASTSNLNSPSRGQTRPRYVKYFQYTSLKSVKNDGSNASINKSSLSRLIHEGAGCKMKEASLRKDSIC